MCCCLVFFFQAEDGIRDGHVTGVQTCALPISMIGLLGGGASEMAGAAATPTVGLDPTDTGLGSANARAVYRDLLRFGPRSRSELTTRLGLSAPTVTRTTDRKSTRLNSSHVAISYAVFCLK